MAEINEKIVMDNFRGKPYKATIVGTDDKEYDCYFEQFTASELAELIPLINEYLYMVSNKTEMSKNFVKKCIPWVQLMMRLSYPDWSNEGRQLFIDRNIIWLIDTMFTANLMQLFKNKKKEIDQLDEYIKNANVSRDNPSKTEKGIDNSSQG